MGLFFCNKLIAKKRNGYVGIFGFWRNLGENLKEERQALGKNNLVEFATSERIIFLSWRLKF